MSKIEVESGVSDKAYPEVFDPRAMLPQPKKKKPGQVSDAQIRQYFENVSRTVLSISFNIVCHTAHLSSQVS